MSNLNGHNVKANEETDLGNENLNVNALNIMHLSFVQFFNSKLPH